MSKEKKKGLALHWKIIIGLVLGIIYAYVAISINLWEKTEMVDGVEKVSKGGYVDSVGFTRDWIAPFGTIFIKALKFIAIPLVLFSIIIGIGTLKNINKLGRLGIKTLGVYLITTVTAVTVGLILVNTVKPGNVVSEEERIKNRIGYELWVENTPSVEFRENDDVRLAKDPQYAAVVEKVMNAPTEENEKLDKYMSNYEDQKDKGPLSALVDMVPDNIVVSLGNPKLMLQVIFFAIFFGVCMLFIPEDKSGPVNKVFDGINSVFLKMVDIVMKAAPFLVFALMAGTLCSMANSIEALNDLLLSQGQYALVVFSGLLFMILLYPLLVTLFVKRFKYMEFWKKIAPAQLLAFSTSSSAATLPVTMECVEEEVGVKPEVASFVLPIGATVNMDGTSLYQAVAVVFLAQLHMVDLTLGEQAIIVMTATLGSIGAAAVPSGGIFMLMMVLTSVGLNPAWIAIILPVDRILDMCRTVVNVTGDASVATVIASSEGELKEA